MGLVLEQIAQHLKAGSTQRSLVGHPQRVSPSCPSLVPSAPAPERTASGYICIGELVIIQRRLDRDAPTLSWRLG